jgi:hypothetical protein
MDKSQLLQNKKKLKKLKNINNNMEIVLEAMVDLDKVVLDLEVPKEELDPVEILEESVQKKEEKVELLEDKVLMEMMVLVVELKED